MHKKKTKKKNVLAVASTQIDGTLNRAVDVTLDSRKQISKQLIDTF
jgi:hypothetical protein